MGDGAGVGILVRVGMARRLLAACLALFLITCVRSASDVAGRGRWIYEVDVPASGSNIVVVATFEHARTKAIVVPRGAGTWIEGMSIRGRGGVYRAVETRGAEWFEPTCEERCTLRYTVNLDELSRHCGDEVDCARRVGPAILSPSMAWLVHPSPRADVPVEVRVRADDPSRFATGMSAIGSSPHTYAFRSFDLDEGSFTAFGPMRRTLLDVPGRRGMDARLEVIVLGDVHYAMSDEAIASWIQDAAHATSALFGRFPVDRATVFVVPSRGEDEVVFGKVLSLAGASIVVLLGDRMESRARHDDWVLVHELIHLGFPTFRGEGRWLGEGLATYLEPLARARAGWITEAEVFRQFAQNMPRAYLAQSRDVGLGARTDVDGIYWGGALFALAADVRIREQTRGAKSLEDVMRALIERGGDATRVWTVSEVLALSDRVTGTTVMTEMVERHVVHAEKIDHAALMSSLGLVDGAESFDDSTSLSWVRKSLVEPEHPARMARRR
jgi:hypothetical protein